MKQRLTIPAILAIGEKCEFGWQKESLFFFFYNYSPNSHPPLPL